MRRLLCGVLAAGLLWLPATRAQADDTAKAIIEKAIQAHGGAAKLAKLQVRQEKTKTTAEAGGQTYTSTQDSLVQLPDRRKSTGEYERQGQRLTQLIVINGDKGWGSSGGQTREYPAETVKSLKEQLHWDYILTLAPLLKDQGLTLSALGEVKVNGRPALGVKVSAKGYRDMDLFFDKDTGLLVKSMVKVQTVSMREYDQEIIYSDYKETDGLKWPMKTIHYRAGNRVWETEITELKFLDQIDDGEFAKP